MLQSVILLWKCAFRVGMSFSVLVCVTRPLPVYPIVFWHPGLLVGGNHRVFHFSHGSCQGRCARSCWCRQSGNLRVRQVWGGGAGWNNPLQYFEFGLQYLVQPLSILHTAPLTVYHAVYHFILKHNYSLYKRLWEKMMHVRSTSRLAAAALKEIAAKTTNNQLLWCLLIKEQKKKKEELNNFCSFKDSSIFHLEFSVW